MWEKMIRQGLFRKRNEDKMNSKLRVRIIDMDSGWIINKFQNKLCEELLNLGVDADISKERDETADINHYPIYYFQDAKKVNHKNDTYMITHIDSLHKVELLKERAPRCGMGICMSKYTMDYLTMYGVPREKLCYINPAHDHVIKPRKYVIGLTHKTHFDCRKRNEMLVDIAKGLDKDYFRFIIMGSGWDEMVAEMEKCGIEVEYYNDFIYDKYVQIVPTFDFFLYFGWDEGNMGYLDALAAGVETVVTPQGVHLDAKGGLTYPCETVDDFIRAFEKAADKKRALVNSVESWTWENFAKKHIEVWEYLLDRKPLSELTKNRGYYMDGIFSVLPKEI